MDGDSGGNPHNGKSNISLETTRNTARGKVRETDINQNLETAENETPKLIFFSSFSFFLFWGLLVCILYACKC